MVNKLQWPNDMRFCGHTFGFTTACYRRPQLCYLRLQGDIFIFHLTRLLLLKTGNNFRFL